MSAALIALPLLTEPWAWTLLRVLVGFCMSGLYAAAESWLNAAATNETRGKVLSAYMIAQTLGIIGAQGLLTLGDAGTSVLFICASILVSVSFAPILLSAAAVPVVEVARLMPLRDLFRGSPLGTVGIFLLGSVYATQSGMGAVFGTQIGLTETQIALFIAMLFAGALVLQYPIGWMSDRMADLWLGRGRCGILRAWVDDRRRALAPYDGRIFCGWCYDAALCLVLGIHERFPAVLGYACGIRRAGVYLWIGRDCRAACHGMGDAAPCPPSLLARARADLFGHRGLCALSDDTARECPGGRNRSLSERAAHGIACRSRGRR